VISANTQAGRGIIQFGGNCVHPSDSGKDGEVDELNRLHGTCHNPASVIAVSIGKLPTTRICLCEVRKVATAGIGKTIGRFQ
jgi:hypothetical protein